MNIAQKSWLLHGCWAAAVVVAFGWGSRRRGEAPSADAGPALTDKTGLARAPFRQDGPLARKPDGRPGDRRPGALAGLFGEVNPSGSDLSALIQQALRHRNPIARRLAFSRLLESLTPSNAGAVREQLVALGADLDQWRDFHYSWGALDGKAAFANAAKSPEADLAATMAGWAAANPKEAQSLLDNLPEELRAQRDQLTSSVVTGLSHNNSAVATEYVLRLGRAGNDKAGPLMEIVANETLRQHGTEAATRWAESLADGPLKGNAMAQVAEAYVRTDPEAAARWSERFADKEYASKTIGQVGSRWAASDPIAAVGWLESLPASTGQKEGLSSAFGDWEDRDPAAAGDYLFAMPKSPQRDSAISGFATGYAWQDPMTAIAWAQDIGDPALRESSMTRVGQAFYRRDPNGAVAWLAESGLPGEVQQRILTERRR